MTDWDDITSAVGLAPTGDRARGRDALRACWAATNAVDHAQGC